MAAKYYELRFQTVNGWLEPQVPRLLAGSPMKERRPVGLPATGNERHGVQGSTPVSEGVTATIPCFCHDLALDLHYTI